MGRMTRLTVAAVVLSLGSMGFLASPASAAAKVSVRNAQGTAAIDPTHMTRLTLSGSDFQSIKNGHGGIYVLFGAIKGTWKPSQGGKTGENYFSVPDSESKNNSGFAKFVAFPGSDTASSANGGEISDDGEWSTSINVPGARFKTLDRDGKATTIDCREMTCGVITIGAHGVANAKNETFTEVAIDDLSASSSTATDTPTADPDAAEEPVSSGRPDLTIDRASARPGRIVAFSATGLQPGAQVNATFADGLAAAGPLTVNSAGEVAGLIELPTTVKTGTYELRLVGKGAMPSTRFAVTAPTETSGLAGRAAGAGVMPSAFATAGFLALLGAVGFGVIRWRRSTQDA